MTVVSLTQVVSAELFNNCNLGYWTENFKLFMTRWVNAQAEKEKAAALQQPSYQHTFLHSHTNHDGALTSTKLTQLTQLFLLIFHIKSQPGKAYPPISADLFFLYETLVHKVLNCN